MLGNESATSSTKDQAGSEAIFNETFELPFASSSLLFVRIFDKDVVSSDLIGIVEIDLATFYSSGLHSGWFTIYEDLSKKKSSGSILLNISLVFVCLLYLYDI